MAKYTMVVEFEVSEDLTAREIKHFRLPPHIKDWQLFDLQKAITEGFADEVETHDVSPGPPTLVVGDAWRMNRWP